MLEEHVVLVSSATDAPEDIATHKVVDIGSKPVDDLDLD